jgi:amino-acid N-acetyltransferase
MLRPRRAGVGQCSGELTQVAAVTITPARSEDVTAVEQLLKLNDLPTAGWRQHWETTIVARDADRVVGSAALELYRDAALLRSVAVEPSMHGRGVGRELVAAALDMAKARGVEAVYLLTTPADGFFKRFGFEQMTRADVPMQVRESIEFTTACPASAGVLGKLLGDGLGRKYRD